MIVVMEPKATEDQINKVVDYIQSKGLRVNINRGEHLTVVAVLGDKTKLNPTSINAIDGVHEIKIIQEPYKLVSRSTKEEDTIIEFKNGVKIGGLERPVIMAGPCSVEKDYEGFAAMVQKLSQIQSDAEIIFTVSCDEADLPITMKDFMVK